MNKRIDILSHADFHGQFRENRENPGLSRFFCAVESIRKRNPETTLLLDAGDESKALWHGKPVYDGLKLLGTDAMVLGNHEFDKGYNDLISCIETIDSAFPVLCANVICKKTGDLFPGTVPYTILNRGGIAIGILGLTSSYTPYIVEKQAFRRFIMLDSVEVIRKYVPEMREQGAEVIILLTHFPFYPNRSGELFEVFDQVKDLNIDVFIGGHIPGDYADVVDNVVITKAGFHGCSLTHTELIFDMDERIVSAHMPLTMDILKDYHEHNENIDAFVRETVKPYSDYFEKKIAVAENDIVSYLNRESPLGNMIADAVREAAKCDFAYFNCTSMGRKLAKGDVTRYTVSEAIGFNEQIHVTEMSGQDIYDLFELVHDPEVFGNNAEIMFSGFRVKINHNEKAGHKVEWIKQGRSRIDRDKIYTVCTSKYMSTGGNGTREFAARFNWKKRSTHIQDAIIRYLKSQRRVKGKIDRRYIFTGTPENDHAPW